MVLWWLCYCVLHSFVHHQTNAKIKFVYVRSNQIHILMHNGYETTSSYDNIDPSVILFYPHNGPRNQVDVCSSLLLYEYKIVWLCNYHIKIVYPNRTYFINDLKSLALVCALRQCRNRKIFICTILWHPLNIFIMHLAHKSVTHMKYYKFIVIC